MIAKCPKCKEKLPYEEGKTTSNDFIHCKKCDDAYPVNDCLEPTQEELSTFVSQYVIFCQSHLVEEMFSKEIFQYDDLVNGYAYKCENCGHTEQEEKDFSDPEGDAYKCPSCSYETEDAPEQEAQEVLEWWLVDSWLLNKLEAHGEPVLRNDFGSWWGRTCSGQAISLDSVIENIYRGVHGI